MRRHLFVYIMNVVEQHDDYFIQKRNAASTLELSCLQKVASSFKMIAYGIAANATYDYMSVGESTVLKCRRHFAVATVKVFGLEYLRLPNEHDTAKLLVVGESRGFPGMLVPSITCIRAGKLSYCMTRNIPGA
jgi:hypothetical protein